MSTITMSVSRIITTADKTKSKQHVYEPCHYSVQLYQILNGQKMDINDTPTHWSVRECFTHISVSHSVQLTIPVRAGCPHISACMELVRVTVPSESRLYHSIKPALHHLPEWIAFACLQPLCADVIIQMSKPPSIMCHALNPFGILL